MQLNNNILAWAKMKYVCAIMFGISACFIGSSAHGKDGGNTGADSDPGASVAHKDQFQWNEHSRLSWDDFKGDVNAATEESAAATYCGIGIKTNSTAPGGKPEIIVYNTFYSKKSWVRSDARIQSILEHEQGHFDLCEIYTRKLRARMAGFDFNVPNVKQALINLYTEVNSEYENRQQAYEQETVHGTNVEQQKKWREMISHELSNIAM